MKDSAASPSSQSPCIGICALDSSGVCIGCARKMQEIYAWANASQQEREEINRRAGLRKKKMQSRPS